MHLKERFNVTLGARNNKNNLLAESLTGCEAVPLDVSNINSLRDITLYAKPDIIIHAAATKFVDRSESFPMETLDVNILGSTQK